MKHLTFIFIFLIGISLSSGVEGQYQWQGLDSKKSREAQMKMELPFDYAIFRSSLPGMLRLEIYIQVFNPFLDFVSDESGYSSGYTLEAAVYDDKKHRAGFESREKNVRIESIERAKSISDFRTSQYNFDLEPGKYEFILTLRNKNTKRILTRRKKINLKMKHYFDKRPRLSQIEFVQAASTRKDKPGSFDKGDLMVIPSVTKIFGGTDESNRVMYYLSYTRVQNQEIRF